MKCFSDLWGERALEGEEFISDGTYKRRCYL